VKILHLVSCRGWSSDAYWAARITCELQRRGHHVTFGARAGTETKVIVPAAAEGVSDIATFAFAGGLRPARDVADVRALAAALPAADVVHVHRGKEHWLAAMANRIAARPRPIVRTRHIVQSVRPHAGNRWLYRHGTDLVVTVTDAIRRQYLASGLVTEDQIVTLWGGASGETFRPRAATPAERAALGARNGEPVVGMIGGLRVMKGHDVAVQALERLVRRGSAVRMVFVGRGGSEERIRSAVDELGLRERVRLAGYVQSPAAAMAALDVALYVPLESEGMSRVLFEYLAAGRALIAARTGVVPEVLHDGDDALLVPAGDADALAEAIARLTSDAPLRARLGAAARAVFDAEYSGARVAERLEAHYLRLARG
jgi:glycosyltransferase involved in cell wall biosynthesis